ncbi:hypothetical protein [uncultured Brachyspira sp.]|uniref:hypothetical protein n=1 Tax=uncultured Brachyspira sp. TaxID=221953 RepID=UPI0026280C6B|nr:hypothetical protein [uncultured Brachyspira sp.]
MLVKFRDDTDIVFLEIDYIRVIREELLIELYKYDLEDYILLWSLKLNYATHSECLSKIEKYQSGIMDLTGYVQ